MVFAKEAQSHNDRAVASTQDEIRVTAERQKRLKISHKNKNLRPDTRLSAAA